VTLSNVLLAKLSVRKPPQKRQNHKRVGFGLIVVIVVVVVGVGLVLGCRGGWLVFWGWLRRVWVFVMSVRCWLGFLGFVVLGVGVGMG
jgi:hypothetical protein